MNYPPKGWNVLPPRLSMDEYADFVEASVRGCDRAHATRQKKIEERIRSPFRMSEGPSGRSWKGKGGETATPSRSP